jgi:MinD-like ATPase involved in chromosome partitioning or flagellar assembly
VINKALSSYNLADLRQQVEGTYDSPVATILPLSEDVARIQSADIFSLRYPDHPFTDGIRRIAGCVEAAG